MSENNLAYNLRKLREEKGMTQSKFAEYVGIYGTQISQFERGINPSVPTLQLLCEALGVTATELLGF